MGIHVVHCRTLRREQPRCTAIAINSLTSPNATFCFNRTISLPCLACAIPAAGLTAAAWDALSATEDSRKLLLRSVSLWLLLMIMFDQAVGLADNIFFRVLNPKP